MSNNVIKYRPKKKLASQKDLYDVSKSIYFSLEDNEFSYMCFGKVSIIFGKDTFQKRFTVVEL